METLDQLVCYQNEYLRLVEEEEPSHVQVLQDYLDLVIQILKKRHLLIVFLFIAFFLVQYYSGIIILYLLLCCAHSKAGRNRKEEIGQICLNNAAMSNKCSYYIFGIA